MVEGLFSIKYVLVLETVGAKRNRGLFYLGNVIQVGHFQSLQDSYKKRVDAAGLQGQMWYLRKKSWTAPAGDCHK